MQQWASSEKRHNLDYLHGSPSQKKNFGICVSQNFFKNNHTSLSKSQLLRNYEWPELFSVKKILPNWAVQEGIEGGGWAVAFIDE